MKDQICIFLIADVKRRLFYESLPRIWKCLDALTQEEIWFRANDNSNSVGNLILHLCGNVRQYILSGIDGQKDERRRNLEFASDLFLSQQKLREKLQNTMDEANEALDRITAEDLMQMKEVQGFKESVISILIHVVEHFSYHTGQIAYFTKYLKDVDLGFYAGKDLNKTS